jgi:2-(1,2-epoxy-1,2-dihydrophenyl)acetyl-CoA isomerase
MTDPHVIYSTDGHVATIRIDRERAMNSMNAQTRAELGDAFAKAETDADIRIVVLTGTGRAFSSGTDLAEVGQNLSGQPYDNSVTDYKPLVDAVTGSDKIYIAAINGAAGGVALGLALGADLAIMSDSAYIFSPFANIGLVPDGAASWFFLQHMGYKRAFAAIAECTKLDAATCRELGLVNKVVAADALPQAAADWAASLAERAPLSLRYTKKILRAAQTSSQADTARLESEYQNKAVRSDDAKAAIGAFLTKTKPVFRGK